MKRSHEDPDPYGPRRPVSGPPPGLAGTHPPSGLPPTHPTSFPHPVLAPGQLAHSFEQMRDNLPRPPFSAPHLSVANPQPTPLPPPPPSHLTPQVAPHGQPSKPPFQNLSSNTTHTSTPNGQQQYQRLKVEDALSYLDQVKLQFGNQPQNFKKSSPDLLQDARNESVYNEFLDIMKEFKSQTIDTPGVISRVSALFKGHPDLIVGFNTFLPPGYKIEVSLTDINTVNVCAPTGTTTHLISGTGLIAAPTQPSQKPNPPPVSSSSSTPLSSTTTSTTTPTTGPKSPTVSVPLLTSITTTKTSSPNVAPTVSLPLQSPGMQSQTQAQHHAINYVTKIKNRFQGQPEVYQKFLDILNNYQTEQKAIKENSVDQYGRPLQEQEVFNREGKLASEVYAQVAKLFNKQEDLLKEFSQFLPDATGSSFTSGVNALSNTPIPSYQPLSKKSLSANTSSSKGSSSKPKKSLSGLQNSNSSKNESLDLDSKDSSDKHLKKRHKSALKDVTLAEAIKLGNFSEFAFFEKVRKALKSPEVYENFLRCLVLFNSEVITRAELIQLTTTFLGKFPELFNWFKVFLGYKENQQTETNITSFKDRGTGGELAHLEIDFASCKRSGASYRAYPSSYTQPKCSGRTQLCKEVLNDTWVSLPSWSEDTQFPGTRKTQYEEYIYKCEDERFELDVVIETNLCTIKVLEGLQKKLSRMSSDDQHKFRLDNSLGGTSDVIHKKAIYRIYGDKSPEVIDGLKKTPHVVLPLVLKRLKQKDEEWRTAQKQFNKVWRDQNEKYYLKSLDHQGINFKQNDLKNIRPKSLVREIEQILEERTDQIEEGNAEISGPHFSFEYSDLSLLEDASSLIIHHMKRQTGIHKEDKTKIKSILLVFLQNMFFAQAGELSDDEHDLDEEMEDDRTQQPTQPDDSTGNTTATTTTTSNSPANKEKDSTTPRASPIKTEVKEENSDDFYHLIYVNSNWYILLRLHQMLFDRLLKMYKQAVKVASFEARDKKYRRQGTAEALRLKKPAITDVEDFYPAFQDMVKNLLDGQLETNQYEDTLRETFGVNSFVAFTMDKLIQNIVRQLHSLVADDISLKIMDIFKQEKSNKATGGPSVTATARSGAELAYQKKVENILVDENCYKIYIYKDQISSKMTFELLPTEDDQSEDQNEIEKWSDYIERFIGNSDIVGELRDHLLKKPIFLLRNAKSLRKRAEALKEAKAAVEQVTEEVDNKETEKDTTKKEIEEDEEAETEEDADAKKKKDTEPSEKVKEEKLVADGVKQEPSSSPQEPQNKTAGASKEKMKEDVEMTDGTSTPVGAVDETDKVEKMDEEEEEDEDEESKLKKDSTLDEEENDDSADFPDVVMYNGLGCKINMNSYKIKYVSGTSDFMYRKNSSVRVAKTHPKVNLKLHNQFENLHSNWLHENTTRDQCHQTEEWLLGKGTTAATDNFMPCLTTKDSGRVGGMTVNRYSVVYTKDLNKVPPVTSPKPPS